MCVSIPSESLHLKGTGELFICPPICPLNPGECNCDSESCRQEGSPLCGENEAFINGGSPCDTTCAAAGLDCLVENFLPAKGCYCLDGFARSAATGECVLANSTDCTSETKAEVNDFVAKAADCEACAPVTPNVCKYPRAFIRMHTHSKENNCLLFFVRAQATAIATVNLVDKKTRHYAKKIMRCSSTLAARVIQHARPWDRTVL